MRLEVFALGALQMSLSLLLLLTSDPAGVIHEPGSVTLDVRAMMGLPLTSARALFMLESS